MISVIAFPSGDNLLMKTSRLPGGSRLDGSPQQVNI